MSIAKKSPATASLTVTAKAPAGAKAGALVVPIVPADQGARLAQLDELPKPLIREIEAAIALLGAKGKADEVLRFPAANAAADLVVTVGLGAGGEAPTAEQLRRAAGAAARQLTDVDSAVFEFGVRDAADVEAVALGALLGAYAFTHYTSGPAPLAAIQVHTAAAKDKDVVVAAERAQILAESVWAVRDLVNTSPLDLYPETFVDAANLAVKGTGVKVHVLDDQALAQGGFGGMVGVGRGSQRPPRLVTLTWDPAKATQSIALIGKGITFDSGGLSLKPPKSMETMKSDMAGAATVLWTLVAVAKLKLPVKVTGYLACAENMPSGSAQRPSDVITMRGGTTVEVLNTDAEGRLVMGDALAYACEAKPDAVLDIATLTGAQMVALGTRVSGVMGSEAVRNAVVEAADDAGELFWPMPMPEELRAGLKSKVADIANVGERWGGMLSAAVFLKEFVGETPWAHLDIAGPAFNEASAHDYTPAGGTGVGLRTLVRFIEAQAAAR